MTGKKLIGNLPTYNLLEYMKEKNEGHQLDMEALNKSLLLETQTFPFRN